MPSHRPRLLGPCLLALVPCAAILLASCDGGSGPRAPSRFVANWTAGTFDAVVLSWGPQLGVDAFELHGRTGDGAWEALELAIPGDATSSVLALDPSVPEVSRLAFRLRARASGRASAWSEASFVRGVRPPSAFSADLRTQSGTRTGPVVLSWTNASAIATDVLLERATLDASSAPGTWSEIQGVTLEAGRHVDDLLTEGESYAYRLRVGADGSWSAPVESRTASVEFAAPSNLRAVKAEGGVQLSWTNRSSGATHTSLSASTTSGSNEWEVAFSGVPESYFHETPFVWPAMTYELTVSRPELYFYVSAEPAEIEPFTLVGPPALAASAVRVPEGEWFARDGDGRFHVAQSVYRSPRLHRATPAGYDTHVLPDDASKLLDPGVVLDASGRPHAVFTRGFVNTLPVGLIHEWWDGSQWDAEPIATDTLQPWGPWDPPKRPCFGIAPDGGVHVVYRRPATFPQEALVHVLRTGDDAVETVVTTASVPDLRRDAFAFGVGADGTAYVAELGFSDSLGAEAVVLSTRSPTGAWTDSLVPSGAVRYGFVGIVPGSAGEVAIAFTRDDGVYAIRRMGGVWESPQLASSFTGDHTSFAGSPDLASLSLTVSADGQARVAVLGSSGWQDVQVGTTGWSGWAGVGRTGAWALFRHDSASSSGILPYSLFDEVP